MNEEQDKALDNLMTWQQEFEKQEPVAWMNKSKIKGLAEFLEYKPTDDSYIPLYTAPRELSNAEIFEIYSQYKDGVPWLKFARAILKKASEK